MKFVVLLVILLGMSACVHESGDGRSPPRASSTQQPSQLRVVRASFYGGDDGFQGKKTASGESFDASALTAAHRSLPFGTRVRVTNPKNQKSVIVRINDRGPRQKGREIDLSKAAATQLGIVDRGVTSVEMEVLDGA